MWIIYCHLQSLACLFVECSLKIVSLEHYYLHVGVGELSNKLHLLSLYKSEHAHIVDMR